VRIAIALCLAACAAASASDTKLRYDKPAANWEKEALPIGNGRLGGMIFGGVQREQVQFNENTLWIGDENDTGAYQAFGDVLIELGGGGLASAACASGHASPAGEAVDASIDGRPETKWCMEHGGRPVVWAAQCPGGLALSGYAFTSGNDMPDRDPRTWTLEGSDDGQAWTLLDRRTGEAPFPARHQRREYAFRNDRAFRHVRFTFTDHGSPTHFQVAEIELGGGSRASPSSYRRELDIGRAVHTVAYTLGGVAYRREAFTSHPAGVMVLRLTADRPGAYTGAVLLTDAHKGKVAADGSRLVSTGSLAGYTYDKDGPPYAIALDYEAQVLVLHEGGSLQAEDGRLRFDGADSLTILVDAGTDFVQDRARGWRGDAPRARIEARLKAAAGAPYGELLAAHVADYRKLFDRVTLDLGAGDESLPTDERLVKHPGGAGDRGLEALVFQYGRYLMISSSRDSLPANLQGLWNNSIHPPWRSDYHTDVNVQMNYWMADPANLGECFRPYALWLDSIREVRKAATKEAFGTRGWTMRAENGAFGGSTWQWVESGSAWCMQNVWDHYAFTQDEAYLRTLAYPMMKEVCEFWLDRLKALPDGTLVAPNGYSPEHGPREDGVSHDQQLVWDVFNNTVEAADALGIDREFRNLVASKRDRLLGPKIGRWGQLQEWMVDRDDPKDTHRHLSHLVAVHPGRQITPATTPELAEAARVSLNARGDVSTGWSTAWKINLWARLRDGDRAHKLIGNLLRLVGDTRVNYDAGGGLYANLFDAHPPFQIDGNFGYTAGVCEMLLQSHIGIPETRNLKPESEKLASETQVSGLRSQVFLLELLPALPKAWPAGRVTGLRARDGFVVDLAWRDGKPESVTIHSTAGRPCRVRFGDKEAAFDTERGKTYRLDGDLSAR
jgi:alpha-L-fucosidase 2